MEMMLDFLKEVFKGIIRAISAHVIQKTILGDKKTTQCRQKCKGGSHKNN